VRSFSSWRIRRYELPTRRELLHAEPRWGQEPRKHVSSERITRNLEALSATRRGALAKTPSSPACAPEGGAGGKGRWEIEGRLRRSRRPSMGTPLGSTTSPSTLRIPRKPSMPRCMGAEEMRETGTASLAGFHGYLGDRAKAAKNRGAQLLRAYRTARDRRLRIRRLSWRQHVPRPLVASGRLPTSH
jgi:hypothetical protein